MRQVNLPLIPESAIDLGDCFAVFIEKDTVTWSHGLSVLCVHSRHDQNLYRLNIARLCLHSGVRQSVMARTTGLHPNTIMSYVSRLQKHGDESFFAPSPVRGGAVLTDDVLAECRRLLDEGFSRSETARRMKIKRNTLDKAIRDGRLPHPERHRAGRECRLPDSRKAASRDAAGQMGMGCTENGLRLAASVGSLAGVPSRFQASLAVACGGVLCAVPALAANGLYAFLDKLPAPVPDASFYYTLTHVVTLLAFMSLLRIKSIEGLRREAPEELGALLGLDRIPEVRCLRERLKALSSRPAEVQAWTECLARQWLTDSHGDMAGMLYVDGHVRAYYGTKAVLPRRFFSRMRLCLRGITDFWVNDGKGQPLFYVERQTNEGLLTVLREELVPALIRDIPGAGAPVRAEDRTARFTLVFDREGYSPAFFREMWEEHRIACLTYRKRVIDEWPKEEFAETDVRLANGAEEKMLLAEKTVELPCRGGGADASLKVREIRRLTDSGHQTSIVTTNMELSTPNVASGMFARWCQENFFHYMEEEFALDALPDSRTTDFPCGKTVVNPAWKTLERARKVTQGKLTRKLSELGLCRMDAGEGSTKESEELIQREAGLVAAVQDMRQDIEEIKDKLKHTEKRLAYASLPESEKFKGLEPTRKRLLDTIRMVAYRAETAMASIAGNFFSAPDTARSWIKALVGSPADILPDMSRGKLTIRVYPLGEERMNRMAEELFQILNDTESHYPGTNLVLHYEMLQSQDVPQPLFPRDQEV